MEQAIAPQGIRYKGADAGAAGAFIDPAKLLTDTARQDASLLETASVVAVDEVPHRSIEVNYEVLNRYVLIAIGLFAALLYFAVLYVGLPS